MSYDTCPICLSNMDDETKIYKLDCNHSFHIECIMKWFRSSKGNCPCCLDNPFGNNDIPRHYLGYWNQTYINERASSLRKLTKKKDCPIKLMNKFDILKKKELELKALQKEKKEFISNEEYKSLVKKKAKLDRQLFNKKKTILNTKAKIISDYPIIQIF
jgi:hypothetical protein